MTRRVVSVLLLCILLATTALAALAPTVAAAQQLYCTAGKKPCAYNEVVCVLPYSVDACVRNPCDPTYCDPCFRCFDPAGAAAAPPEVQCIAVAGAFTAGAVCEVGAKEVGYVFCQYCLPLAYVWCTAGTEDVACHLRGVDVADPALSVLP